MGLCFQPLHAAAELPYVPQDIVQLLPQHEVEPGPCLIEGALGALHGGPDRLTGPFLGQLAPVQHVLHRLLDGVLQGAQDAQPRPDMKLW